MPLMSDAETRGDSSADAGYDPVARALRQEIAQLEHELRRVRDALERNPSHRLEQRARQLRDNIELCQRELSPHRDRSERE